MQRAILGWYDTNGRSLPFRGTRDPYAILVSEVMAQQTQIGRVSEAWSRFMTTFSTIEVLAAASPADVLRAWRGLGYNRRALNLWRAAQAVMTEHGGVMPGSVESLQLLPGIGPYTARAVAAIAFGARVGAVDTNVRRVLGRSLGGGADGLGQAELQLLADASVPRERPADWTHALMDIGSTFCKPLRPNCEKCPARAWCRFAAGRGTGGSRDAPRRRAAARSVVRSTAFPSTTRWLRGRILDRLRAAEGVDWHRLDAPIGDHDASRVAESLRTLAVDGLVELHPDSSLTARLPLVDDQRSALRRRG
jgi:A/G-specific adenine glycosylase